MKPLARFTASLWVMKSTVGCLLLLTTACQTRRDSTFSLQLYVADSLMVDSVFVAGSFNKWNPGDPQYLMEKEGRNTFAYYFTTPMEEDIEYKYTTGSWGKAETNPTLENIPNRIAVPAIGTQKTDTVLAWSKGKRMANSTRAENVYILSEGFDMPQLDRKRRVWLYLPKSYEEGTTRYPVLYLQDGQNLFDQATSFSGEWDVDGSLNKFAEEGNQEFIVIGIDNGGDKRLDEYSPYTNKKFGGGQGLDYTTFLVETLKPMVDQVFRTKPEAEHTLVGGSSMGGLISFYAALKHPETFGKALVLSPSFHFSESFYDLPGEFSKVAEKPKIYLLAGTKESKTMVSNLERMKAELEKFGWGPDQLQTKIVEGGTHSEALWKKEFIEAVGWLFLEKDKVAI